MTQRILAQTANIGGVGITGPLKGKNIIGKDVENLGDVINILIPFVMSMAGIILFIIFIWGGIDIMMSRGTADKMKSGKAKLTAGVVGFILLALSYFATKLISYIFNVGEGML